MNRSEDRWERDLTVHEIGTEIENFIFLDKGCGNPIMNMRKIISENDEGYENISIDNDED